MDKHVFLFLVILTVFSLCLLTEGKNGRCLVTKEVKDARCVPQRAQTDVAEGTICETGKRKCYICLSGGFEQIQCRLVPRRRRSFGGAFSGGVPIGSIDAFSISGSLGKRLPGGPLEGIWTRPEREPWIKGPFIGPQRVLTTDEEQLRELLAKCGGLFSMGVYGNSGSIQKFPFVKQGVWVNPAVIQNRWTPTGSIDIFDCVKKQYRCPILKSPAYGTVQCARENFEGSVCKFFCNPGYLLTGSSQTTCVYLKGYDQKTPVCKMLSCGKLTPPANGKIISCTGGNTFKSMCGLSCAHGYVAKQGAHAVCSATKVWTKLAWACEDKVKPVIHNCPTRKINTIEKKYRWKTITATDNTGKVKLTQTRGKPPGSTLTIGQHLLQYEARDESGNRAKCFFIVELKQTDCPRPTSEDPDVKFTCNGMTGQSACLLTCGSGARIEGSRYISCVAAETENSTSVWEPVHGIMGKCFKRKCPALKPPNNGALACDKQMGGTVCQLQCQDGYDVDQYVQGLIAFVCSSNSERWVPSNKVPDCTEVVFPDEYLLPTQLFYFSGDCDDEASLEEIKKQFLKHLKNAGLSACAKEPCTTDDVDISCGEKTEGDGFFDFRKKRRAVIKKKKMFVRIKMTLRLKNSNRTMSPEQAKALLSSLLEKSKKSMSSSRTLRTLLFKPKFSIAETGGMSGIRSYSKSSLVGLNAFSGGSFGPKLHASMATPVLPNLKVKSSIGNMTMVCSPGRVQKENTSGICVPCAAGTYHDTKTDQCPTCAVGWYQDKTGMTSCKRCSQHHTTEATGTTSSDECIELCAKDNFSPTGYLPCYPCRPGTYQTAIGAKSCDTCPTGKAAKATPKCLENIRPALNETLPPEMIIGDFLLTCDSEVCLSF